MKNIKNFITGILILFVIVSCKKEQVQVNDTEQEQVNDTVQVNDIDLTVQLFFSSPSPSKNQ